MHIVMVHGSQCPPPCWKNHEPNANPVDPFAQDVHERRSLLFSPGYMRFLRNITKTRNSKAKKVQFLPEGKKKSQAFKRSARKPTINTSPGCLSGVFLRGHLDPIYLYMIFLLQ